LLNNRAFIGAQRRGKALAAVTDDNERAAVFAFGMTGFLAYRKSHREPENGTGVRFHFAGDAHLDFVVKRKLGRLRIADSFDRFIEDHDIGPDALDIDTATFKDRLHGRTGLIKPTLMNQSVIAGIGNLYADEILFKSSIRPDRPANKLSDAELDALSRNTRLVLRTAIRNNASPRRMPRTWILPVREDNAPRCPACRRKLLSRTVSGRRAVFCPRCQQ
jgi:formamidopyrimidine-DNA glycosylase